MVDLNKIINNNNNHRVDENQSYDSVSVNGTETDILPSLIEQEKANKLALNLTANVNSSTGWTKEEYDKYTKYGVIPRPYMSEDDLNKARAERQGWVEQFGRFLMQTLGSEIAIGTVKGFSDLVTGIPNIYKEIKSGITGEENNEDFTNPVSEYLEGWQEAIRDRFEIFEKNPNKSFDISDWGWWFNGATSVASTLSLMVPGMSVAKGVSSLSKLAKLDRLLYKTLKATNTSRRAAGLTKQIGTGLRIGNTALISRTAENVQEAREAYKVGYDMAINKLNVMSNEEKDDFLYLNPEFEGKSNKEIAEILASRGANETFDQDYWMLLFDVMQFKGISKLWNGAAGAEIDATTRLMQKNAIKALQDGTKELTDDVLKEGINIGSRLKETLKYAVTHPFTSLQALELSEGVEEGFQGIQSERAKEIVNLAFDPNISLRNLESYLTDGEILEQAVWGVIGGWAFQGAAKGYYKAKDKLNAKALNKAGKLDKNSIEYQLALNGIQKTRVDEIKNRYTRLLDLKTKLDDINNGIDPYGKTNENGEKAKLYMDYEIENAKHRVIKEFIEDLAMNSVDAGTSELLKEYIIDPAFNKTLKDAGLNEDMLQSKDFEQMLDDSIEAYEKTLQQVYDNVMVENPDIHRILARRINRDKIKIDNLNNLIDNIDEQLNENESYRLLPEDYRNKINLLRYREALKAINAALEENFRSYGKGFSKDNLVTYSGFTARQQELFRERANIVKAISELELSDELSKTVKAALKETVGKDGVRLNKIPTDNDILFDKLNEDIDNYLQGLTINEYKNLPEGLRKLENDKAKYELQKLRIESSIPIYKNEYDEAVLGLEDMINNIAGQRYLDAVSMIVDKIEKSTDLEKTYKDLMEEENLSKEERKAVELLKLGTGSSILWQQMIKQQIEKSAEERIQENTPNIVDRKGQSVVTQPVEEEQVQTPPQQSIEPEAPLKETKERENLTEEEKTFIDEQEEEVKHLEPVPDEDIPLEVTRVEDMDVKSKVESEVSRRFADLYRAIFEGIESEAFNKLYNEIKEECHKLGFNNDEEISSAFKDIILSYKNIFDSSMGSVAEKNIRKILTTVFSSNVPVIDDNIINMFNEFIDSIENVKFEGGVRRVNGKELFKEILDRVNKGEITKLEAESIFYAIKTIFYNYNVTHTQQYGLTSNGIIFENINDFGKYADEFFSKLNTIREKNGDNDFHLSISSELFKREDMNEILHLNNNEELSVKLTESGLQFIGITPDGEDIVIGIASIVSKSNTNNEYTFETRNYKVKLENGNYTSNLDEIVNYVINNEDIFKIIFSGAFKLEDSSEFIRLETDSKLQKLINDSKLKYNNKKLYSIISKALRYHKITDYYDKQRLFANYATYTAKRFRNAVQTFELQNRIAITGNANVKLNLSFTQTANINDKNQHYLDDESLRFDSTKHRYAYIKDGKLRVEETGEIFDISGKQSEFGGKLSKSFQHGLLLDVINGNPMIAAFTGVRTLGECESDEAVKLRDAVKEEIKNLMLHRYSYKTLDFDKLILYLGNLLGNNVNNIFGNFQILHDKNQRRIFIREGYGDNSELKFILYEKQPDFRRSSNPLNNPNMSQRPDSNSVISFVTKEGYKTKGYNLNGAEEIAEVLSNYISSRIKIHGTRFNFDNATSDDTHSNNNGYFYKEKNDNGKLHINVGGQIFSYNNLADLYIKTGCFKTNAQYSEYSGYMKYKVNEDENGNLYLDMNPDEEFVSSIRENENILNNLKEGDKINVTALASNYLKRLGIDVSDIVGENKLISDEAVFSKEGDDFMNYDLGTKQITLTEKGRKYIINNPSQLMILFAHENVHKSIDKTGFFRGENSRKRVDILLETYDQFKKAVNNSNNKTLKDWITKFESINDKYILKNKRSELAEEWLAEAITQPIVQRKLNEIRYDNSRYEAENSGVKTILQRIIDFIREIFNLGEIKNDSILKQIYAIAGQHDIIKHNTNPFKSEKTEPESEPESASSEKGKDVHDENKDLGNGEDNTSTNQGENIITEDEDEETNDEDEDDETTSRRRGTRRDRMSSAVPVDNSTRYDLMELEENIDRYIETDGAENPMNLEVVPNMETYLESKEPIVRRLLRSKMDSNELLYICR